MSELKNKQKNGQLNKGFFMVKDILIAQIEK